jgi:type I restriction enzyme R subunit
VNLPNAIDIAKIVIHEADEPDAVVDTREVMGEPKLRVIAHELVTSVKNTVTVDWMHREASRARMRVLVKKILRKYGYPPDLQDAAVQVVLQQAEALSAEWAVA